MITPSNELASKLVSDGPEGRPTAEFSAADVAPGKSQVSVLVVDDNEDSASLLGEVLELFHYDVAVAYDGASALEIAKQRRFDFALLDIGLPLMDGYELARQLSKLPDGGPNRLVAVTGYGRDSEIAAAKRAGFHAHVVKPVDLEQLKRTLRELGQS